MSDESVTMADLRILKALYERGETPYGATKLAADTGLGISVLYGSLARLERRQWIEGVPEPRQTQAPNRRPRRLYRLTPDGYRGYEAALRSVTARNLPALRWTACAL